MNTLVQLVSKKPAYTKILAWGKLVTITSGAQAIIQIAGIASGILIIRMLPMQEYAYYTIANAMLGTMTSLSDGGISTGVMAQGGKKWQNKRELGTVVVTGLDLRKKFGLLTLIIFIPILLYLLMHQGASWVMSVLVIMALIPAFFANLSDSLLEIAPKLHQDIRPLQANQLVVGLGRLMLSCATIIVFPFTIIALFANGLPRIYGNIKLKKLTEKIADLNQLPDINERQEILKVTKKILPVVVFYSLSSQITIWLLSLLGNSSSIAQIGALSRLTIFTSFFSIILAQLVFPRFARLHSGEKRTIILFFVSIQFLLIFAFAIIIAVTWVFAPYLLQLLGKLYHGLTIELILSVISSCVALLASVAGNLLNSRGWVINPVIVVCINIGSLIVSYFLFDLSKLNGVLYYNILMNTVFYVFLIFYSIKTFKLLNTYPVV